MDVDSRRFYPM
uniref:Uncharacterized protein n=1 Tax=Arundo donax TaxID=35708 RepID=A0A0A9EGY6_ARUDO